MSEMIRCSTCGYSWIVGQDGSHICSQHMVKASTIRTGSEPFSEFKCKSGCEHFLNGVISHEDDCPILLAKLEVEKKMSQPPDRILTLREKMAWELNLKLELGGGELNDDFEYCFTVADKFLSFCDNEVGQ